MNMLLLVWRNSFRKKTRFTLTCLSVVVAFFLFTALAAINHALTINVGANNQYRLMTNHKISITRSLPINYQQKISALSGVEQVTYASWFGGYFKDEKNQLAATAVEHGNYFSMFDEYEISNQQLQQWKNTRIGLVIGEKVAKKYDWKLGDKVPLASSIWMNKEGSFSWEFEVSAIYKSKDSSGDNSRVFLHHDYFDEARAYAGYSVSWLSTLIDNNADVDKVSSDIDTLFANTNASTRTTTEQVFIKEQAQQFVDMAMVIKLVLSAVFFTLLLIVCNTMMQTNRERLNESAMMKALGFSSANLTIQLFLESLLLLSIGAILGGTLAHLLLGMIKQQFAEFLPGIAIMPDHYVTMSGAVVAAAIICSFFPAISIKRLSIARTLGAMA